MAEGEDLIGVSKGEAAGLGELQSTPAPIEKRLPQCLFELLDLHADRRVRQAELPAGSLDPTLAHGEPKIHEMMVV